MLLIALHAGAAFAQQTTGDDVPPGTTGSGIITLDQMTEDLQFFRIEQQDIYVHFVLPVGWELLEEGIDPATGEVDPDIPAYVLLSRAPVHTPDEATDFIFELDIYYQGLTEDLPEDTPEDQRNPGVQLWDFLNSEISLYLRGGLTLRTARNQIEAKPYGTTSPQREPTFFVPLAYDTPSGAELYTFTTFTGDTVWELKFLVSEGQIDNYGALIALILDNSFGLTEQELKDQQKKIK
jgi:hypothetical protein